MQTRHALLLAEKLRHHEQAEAQRPLRPRRCSRPPPGVLVDESEPPGAGRLVGVEPSQYDRLKDLCIGRLVPPFCLELVAVPLSGRSEIAVAVFVDPDTARRPVMVENKVYVRTEAGKTLAGWYCLRKLFAEQPPEAKGGLTVGRNVGMLQMYAVSNPPPFIVIRLLGPRPLFQPSHLAVQVTFSCLAQKDQLAGQLHLLSSRVSAMIGPWPQTHLERRPYTTRSSSSMTLSSRTSLPTRCWP